MTSTRVNPDVCDYRAGDYIRQIITRRGLVCAHTCDFNAAAMPVKHGARVVAHLGSTKHPKSKLPCTVYDHHLNHCVAVTIPNNSAEASWIDCCALLDASFQVLELSLPAVVELHRAALTGRSPAQVALASLGRRMDRDGACGSSCNGDLLIDITGDMFQTLGLQGHRIAKQAGESANNAAVPIPYGLAHAAREQSTASCCRHPALLHLPPHILIDLPAWQRPL
jgi:hypothetical protein